MLLLSPTIPDENLYSLWDKNTVKLLLKVKVFTYVEDFIQQI